VIDTAATTMMQAIQEMRFFLHTTFGDSNDFAGSTVEVKTQGLCQWNGAALAGWTVISITIFNSHKAKGHDAHFLCPFDRAEHTSLQPSMSMTLIYCVAI
jgi:hypothetical protein